MDYEKIERGNLINLFPIEEGDKVLYADNLEEALNKEGTYDWIFLLPYEEKEAGSLCMERLLEKLTEKGHLLLAFENPFSLHKMAGEVEEDGTLWKAFLPGGFEEGQGISLPFFKKQAEEAFGQCEKEYCLKMYYPYPDIRFPSAVYTDEYLPKSGECDENLYNFAHARFGFFDEMQAVDEMVKAGVYGQFANGYLAEIAKEPVSLLYCRYSVERSSDKKICTKIWKNKQNEKTVQKAAYVKEANEHIKKMSEWEKRLGDVLAAQSYMGKPILVNRITESGEKNGKWYMNFEFIQGESLENYLDSCLEKQNFPECRERLLSFCHMIKQIEGKVPFRATEEFQKVFGMPEGLNETLLCLPVTDIDMVCQNVFLGKQITLIDYEWTFDFPIPVDYLVYRVLFCYLEQKNRRSMKGFDNSFDFYYEMGITAERKKQFEQMEIHFQKYVQGTCRLLRDMYLEEGKPVIPMSVLKEQLKKQEEDKVLVFYDTGNGFLEKDSFFVMPKVEETGNVSFVLELGEKPVQAVKIQFGQKNMMVRIGLLEEDENGSREISYKTNGISVNPILYLYKEAPSLVIEQMEERVRRLYVSFWMEPLPEVFVKETAGSLSDMRAVIANREEQIANYENSTSWKITKPLRSIGRKK